MRRLAVQIKERPTVWQPVVMRLKPVLELDADTFFHLAQLNKDLRLELNAEGELILMPPAGGNTGDRNSEINMQPRLWAKREGSGKSVRLIHRLSFAQRRGAFAPTLRG